MQKHIEKKNLHILFLTTNCITIQFDLLLVSLSDHLQNTLHRQIINHLLDRLVLFPNFHRQNKPRVAHLIHCCHLRLLEIECQGPC